MMATALAPQPGAEDLVSLPACTPATLLRRAAAHPDRVALRRKELGIWREYTWREYAQLAAVYARGFESLGIERGDKVAILGDNRPEWLAADVALQGLGALVVGLYATSPAAELEYLLQHSESVALVVEDQEQLDKVLETRLRLPRLRHIIVIETRGVHTLDRDPMLLSLADFAAKGKAATIAWFREVVAVVSPSSVAILVYTSGTTGPPKGAMITHANLEAAADALLSVFDRQEGDEVLSYLPLCHILERLLSSTLAIRSGSTVNFGGGGESLIQDLREVQPHAFMGVPRVWEKMLASVEIRMGDASWLKRRTYSFWLEYGARLARRRLAGERLSLVDRATYALGWVFLFRPLRDRLGLGRVRFAGSGAAPIAPKVLEFFWALGVPVTEGYGMTENTGVATFTPRDAVKIGKVGKTYPGSEIRIAGDGEILTRGPGTFAGYYKNEAATQATIDADGWLHTGDVGELDADGYLTITDRKKDIIITAGGKNISPSWIENALKVSPYVREAIVMGDRRRYVTALIGIELETVANWATRQRIAFTTYADLSSRPEVIALIDQWVDQVNGGLAPVEAVKRFALLPRELDHEEGELTATQKVKRRAIAEQYAGLIEAMYR